jgi:molybdopterin-guanine dinucleotide biosynthesis protein A
VTDSSRAGVAGLAGAAEMANHPTGIPRADACGIVLAGGRASRFGGDKLTAMVGARPLLSLAVETVAGVCEEVIVTIAPGYHTPSLPPNARAVVDVAPFGGPLLGLLSGAMHTERDRLLVVGGDMPTMVPEVLRQLLAALSESPQEAVALGLGPADEPQPLPLAIKRRSLIERGEDLESVAGRSLRWLLDGLDRRVIPEAAWRLADPLASTLCDVDRPDDLADLRSP